MVSSFCIDFVFVLLYYSCVLVLVESARTLNKEFCTTTTTTNTQDRENCWAAVNNIEISDSVKHGFLY